MTMLEEINELVQQLASGQTTHDAGLDRARPIERAGTQYGPALDAVMSALCGLVFGVILGIAWIDVLLGGAFSIVSLSGLLAWSLLGGAPRQGGRGGRREPGRRAGRVHRRNAPSIGTR